MFKITMEWMETLRSDNGGFTASALDPIGIKYPLGKGDVYSKVGNIISLETKAQSEAGRNTLSKERNYLKRQKKDKLVKFKTIIKGKVNHFTSHRQKKDFNLQRKRYKHKQKTFLITLPWLIAHETDKGDYTMFQVFALGLTQKTTGWLKKQVGCYISEQQKIDFEDGKNIYAKEQTKIVRENS